MNHSQKSLHVNYSNKQKKVLFTLSCSHRDTLCILDLQEMHSVHFLVNIFQTDLQTCIVHFSVYKLAVCLYPASVGALLCLGTLPTQVNWSIEIIGRNVMSPMCICILVQKLHIALFQVLLMWGLEFILEIYLPV